MDYCNEVPQNGWLKKQKFIVSNFWSLKVQDQGVPRLFFSEGCDGEHILCLSPSFCGLLAISGIFLACRCVTPIFAVIFTWHSQYVSSQSFPLSAGLCALSDRIFI